MRQPSKPDRWLTAALALCLFFIVVGSKWAVAGHFGSAMPDWDQWDAEALKLLVPWFEGKNFIAQLFEPHNEHRIVVTKLQNLALTLANGQWDSRLECVANAVLHGAIAVAFWLVARGWLGVAPASCRLPAEGRRDAGATSSSRRTQLLSGALFVLTALLFGLPLAWQNILGGFHSQQYWLVGLSFATIVALPFARAWSLTWWAGSAAAILAMFTMGSGFLGAVVIFGLVAWRAWRREATLRDAWPTLALMAALVAIGLATRVEVYYHQELKAKTAHDFGFTVLRSLEWPLRNHDWVGFVLWAPWLILLVQALRRRAKEESRVAQSLLALGAWVLVQIVATAYARGADGDYPAIRYMDTLAVGAFTNAVALAWLLAGPLEKKLRLAVGVLGLAWLAALGLGFAQLMERNVLQELPDTRKYYAQSEQHLLGYLVTNDPAHLAFQEIPYPSAEALIERLKHASLRRLMPAEVRPSLRLETATTTGFRENHASELTLEADPRVGLSPATVPLAARPTWGSFGARGAGEQGIWRSAPVPSELGGWLKFETAGQLGEPGLALELRAVETDALLASVVPTKIPGDAWRAAYVRVPAQPFVVVARDSDPQRWMAFSAPVEMGTWSFAAWQLAKHGLLISEIAAILALILGLGSLMVRHPPADQSRC